MFLLSATEHLDKIVGIGKNQMVLCSIKGIEGRCFRQNLEDKSAHICLVSNYAESQVRLEQMAGDDYFMIYKCYYSAVIHSLPKQ